MPSALVYAARGNTWSNFVNYADTKTLYEWYEDSISAFEMTDEYGNHVAPVCSCELVGVLCGCIFIDSAPFLLMWMCAHW